VDRTGIREHLKERRQEILVAGRAIDPVSSLMLPCNPGVRRHEPVDELCIGDRLTDIALAELLCC
jgi:hypothetical protein